MTQSVRERREVAKMSNAGIDRAFDVMIDIYREHIEATKICERILGEHSSKDVEQVYAALTKWKRK